MYHNIEILKENKSMGCFEEATMSPWIFPRAQSFRNI